MKSADIVHFGVRSECLCNEIVEMFKSDKTLIKNKLVFIISAPRSGSTLTTRLLGSHPDIFGAPELHLIHPLAYLGYFDYKAEWQPRIASSSTASSAFQNLSKMSIRSIVNWLPNGESDYLLALRRYCDSIYYGLLEKSGKELIVDKSPPYATYHSLVTGIYPDGKYIILTRNPIHIGFSIRNWILDLRSRGFAIKQKSDSHYQEPLDETVLEIVELYLRGVLAYLSNDYINRFHVRYEDVVLNTENQMRKICKFLDVQYGDSMLSYDPMSSMMPGNPGDTITIYQHDRPIENKVQSLPSGVQENLTLAYSLSEILSEDEVATMGYSYSEIKAQLDSIRDKKNQ